MSDRDDPIKSHPEPGGALLVRLGFGPETALMNDPKLFVDRKFLAALLAEFESELGSETAGAALFQIGLAHGLRDAENALQQGFDLSTGGHGTAPRPASLVVALGPTAPGFRLMGHWPEIHEAEARLQRVGLAAAPSCRLSAGYTSGWLTGTTDRDLVVVETECIAAGGEACHFEAREPGDWLGDPRSEQILGLDLRQGLVSQRPSLPSASRPFCEEAITPFAMGEPSERAVNVWGPVMVLPFTYTEEVLATIEMLGRDSSTQSVGVVVIDLTDVLLEEGFMAAGLESALESIENWGAEVILAGVSSLSEPVVEGLEVRHMLTRKDLPDAIATAFQITDAQRHVL